MKKRVFSYWWILSSLLVVGFLFGVYAQSPEGIAGSAACGDSDGGKNYYQKSSFVFDNVNYEDKCECNFDPLTFPNVVIDSHNTCNTGGIARGSPRYIKEYYCVNEGAAAKVESFLYECPAGCDASLGACKPIIKEVEGLELAFAKAYCKVNTFFIYPFRSLEDSVVYTHYSSCIRSFDEVVNDPNNEGSSSAEIQNPEQNAAGGTETGTPAANNEEDSGETFTPTTEGSGKTRPLLSLRSSIAPDSGALGSEFEIKCDYGIAGLSCIVAKHGGEDCSFLRFDGTFAVFSCNAKNAGLQENYCNIFQRDDDNRCWNEITQQISSTEITNSIISNTPVLFLRSSSAPASVILRSEFEVKCDYGIMNLQCVSATHGGIGCTYLRFEGNSAIFRCRADSIGIKENVCNIYVVGGNPNCSIARSDIMQQRTDVTNPPLTQVICRANSDCGNDAVENAFCSGKDTYENHRIYSCNNAGTAEARCASRLEARKVSTCPNACYQGACTKCGVNSDCDDVNAGTVDVCVHPGLADSYCTNTAALDCYAGQSRQCGYNNVGVCRLGTQTCGANNQWGDCIGVVMPVDEGTNSDGKDNDCDGEVDEGTVSPPPICNSQCTMGQRGCQGDGYTLCYQDSNGCYVWSGATSCGSGKTCKEGYCIPLPVCQNPCAFGEKKCDAQYYRVCRAINGDTGCTEWSGRISCGSGKVCVGAGECKWNE